MQRDRVDAEPVGQQHHSGFGERESGGGLQVSARTERIGDGNAEPTREGS
ncbi:hypothetical protein [Nocardia otitidiscaviarum]|nr:hypothetical protein [Nocardia otitidiscaviarum]